MILKKDIGYSSQEQQKSVIRYFNILYDVQEAKLLNVMVLVVL